MPKEGIDREARELFFKTVAKISGSEEAEIFFKDLFSSAEIKDFSRRILAAMMLRKGITFDGIRQQMGMGPGTINKIYFKTKGSRVLDDLLD